MRQRSILAMIPMGFLALFFFWPTFTTLSTFFDIAEFVDVVSEASVARIAWFSLWQATLSVALTIFVALPATWALSRFIFPGYRMIAGMLSAPFVMPAVVVASGVLAVLPSNNNTGVIPIVWAHSIFNISVVLRLVGPRWEMLNHQLENAAALLGASPLQRCRYVVWPHIRNATLNAALVVFLYCFTSFGVIVIVGGFSRRTLESEIFTQAIRLGDTSTATALAVVQILIIGVVVVLAQMLQRNEASSPTIHSRQVLRDAMGRRWIVPAIAITSTLFVMLPFVATVVRSVYNSSTSTMSLAGWRALFESSLPGLSASATDIVVNSIQFALLVAVMCVPLSLLVVLSRNSVAYAFSSAPMVVSAATLGIGLVITFNTDPVSWRSQWWLVPVIHAAIAFPLTTRTLRPAYNAVPQSLRNAAAVLGASPPRRFVHVDLALLRSALLRTTGLSMAMSLGEFGATSFLSRSGTTTLPIAISQLFGKVGQVPQQAAFALSTVFIVVAVGVMSRA